MPIRLVITDKNVKAVRTVDLVSRFNHIQRVLDNRIIHPQVQSELLHEKELIEQALVRRKKADYISEQTTLPGLEKPKLATYKDIVVAKLVEFYKAEKEIRRLNRKIQRGIELVFPTVTTSYGQGGSNGFSEFKSKSEKAVVLQEERKEEILSQMFELDKKIEEMEKALEALSEVELEYVERKYFTDKNLKDYEIIAQMNIGKTTFYKKIQPKAYEKLADALNLL